MGNVQNIIKDRLWEVEVLRPLAVLLVVVLHSFTVYWGKWSAPDGFVDVSAYKWIAATSFSFTMELFVMLSGYIFGYQLIVQGRKFTLSSLIQNKLKRLILPSLIFGAIYALIFYYNREFFDAVYAVLKGAGQLWFLQMLFWCFILGFALYQTKMQEGYKMLLLAVIVILSAINFPLRLDKAYYYLFFFYLGINLIRRQDICRKLSRNTGLLIVLLVVYLLAFISYERVFPSIDPHKDTFLLSTAVKLLKLYWVLTYSLAGSLFVFLLAYRLIKTKCSISPVFVYCSSMSFGVYLFHQIIIEILYYKTSLPSLVGPYWLPWVGFLITITGSILLVLIVRRLNLKFLGI